MTVSLNWKSVGSATVAILGFVVTYAPAILPFIPPQYAQLAGLVIGLAGTAVSAQSHKAVTVIPPAVAPVVAAVAQSVGAPLPADAPKA